LAGGNKKRALLALKKKKYQEQLLEKTENQMMHLEELASSFEQIVMFETIKDINNVIT
jgi:charged multivesicular body protein 6